MELTIREKILVNVLLLFITLGAGNTLNAADSGGTDQGLGLALRATLANHPAVKGQNSELNAQAYAIDTARTERYPSLALFANNLDDQINRSTVRLQQPLWTFGKIETSIKQAEAGFSAEQWALLDVKRQLIAETAAAYARIEGINQRDQVARDNIARHEELYQSIERRQQGELAAEADVQLANSRLIQARAQRERIMGELQVALSELRALTQVYVTADIPVDPGLADLPAQAEVESLAIETSAYVKEKRERLNEGRLEVEREKAASRPNLFFRVERDFSDTSLNIDRTRVGLAFEANYAGLGLNSRSRVRGAVARSDAAQYDLEAAINDVTRRISSLMLNRQMQQALITSQSEAVDSLESTMASFMRQYESGLKSWVEVLNTQRELTELKLQLAQTQNDWLILSLRVAALTGGLDKLSDIETL